MIPTAKTVIVMIKNKNPFNIEHEKHLYFLSSLFLQIFKYNVVQKGMTISDNA